MEMSKINASEILWDKPENKRSSNKGNVMMPPIIH